MATFSNVRDAAFFTYIILENLCLTKNNIK